MERGTYVSRSTYQKVVEENKQLKRDIRVLILCPESTLYEAFEEWEKVYLKWENYFKKNEEFNNMLIEVLTEAQRQRSVATEVPTELPKAD